MNARQTTHKLCMTPALLALALTLSAGNAAAATYNLVAMPFGKTMPDGTPVLMWGFTLDGGAFVPSTPGPALVVPPGDTSLTINLRNFLFEPVSIVIPGQAMPTTSLGAPLAPVNFTDSTGRQRVRSFTAEAAPFGGTQSYTWNNLKPGTYLYHSGTHPQVQVQMGLYGAVTHDAAAGQAYAGVPYSSQVTLLFSEIDPALHTAVANGQYGPGKAMSSTIDYAPKYFLINGVPHTAASLPLAAGSAGQPTLLRLLNAGLQSRSPVLQGMHMRLMAEDGSPYPYAREQYSAFLPALKTVDAVITPTAAATYPLYDRRLAVTNPGPSGSVAGGMLAKLVVTGASPGTPVAVADSYSTIEETLLSMPLPGVLANDSGTGISAVLVSSVNHGSLNLNADGSFSYTPASNYSGADSFSYKASNGTLASAPVTVSLSVTPVNDAPVATADAFSIAAGSTLSVASPGVLGNDSDVDGGALTAVNPSVLAGLSLNPDGSFSYTAPATAGTQSFTYQASDGTLTSSAATVTITVLANQAPVAANDTSSAPRRTTVLYTPVNINVLANDSDPNGNLDPTTVAIVVAPNKGGTVSVNANGTVDYTPRRSFRGTENFSYRVQDTAGATSNTAIVRVNVP